MVRQSIINQPLVDILHRRQDERKQSDAKFAAFLGVSRQLWQGTRIGTIPIGLSVVKGAVRAFENDTDVMDAITAFLRYNHKAQA